ncbi:dethiobiotin synthetase [Arthrobacter sp. UYEF6]
MSSLISGAVRPRSGDLVLARIVQLGHHRHIEQPNGRRAVLHDDDEIIVTYGDRYATDQFESQVPATLGQAQLVASGGIASEVLSRSQAVRRATEIEPIGLVGNAKGNPLNVDDFALKPVRPQLPRPRTIAVIGTAMNSGKTTTVHCLVHGLGKAGVRVGAAKATGTGSGNDYWCMLDAGAHLMLDFTDVGLASTYRQPMDVVEAKLGELINHLTASGTDLNLVEVADGIYQGETSRLLESEVFRSMIDAVIFAAPDSMGAMAGVSHLQKLGHNVLAVTGLLTRSPLAIREAEAVTGLPVLTREELTSPATAAPLLGISDILHAASEDKAQSAIEAQQVPATSEVLIGPFNASPDQPRPRPRPGLFGFPRPATSAGSPDAW